MVSLLKRIPYIYELRIFQLGIKRHVLNILKLSFFARTINNERLAYRVKQHQSLLRRKLGTSDPQLQENKVVNLKLAVRKLDGIIIKPGQIFSFWQLVGKTTAKKGYIEGLLLSRGEAITGIGGGICQLANLLYWLALHSPLQVIERHHHSFDPFPDDRRTLPFGSGASVFYNYVDLRFYNPTNQSFQFKVWVTDLHLKGEILTEESLNYSYHIEERKHRFLQQSGKNYRENEIWRRQVDKRTGETIQEEFLIHNFSEVKYDISDMIKPEETSQDRWDR